MKYYKKFKKMYYKNHFRFVPFSSHLVYVLKMTARSLNPSATFRMEAGLRLNPHLNNVTIDQAVLGIA